MATDTESSVAWLVDVPSDEMRRIVDTLHRTHRLVSAITDRESLLITLMDESKQLASAEACSLILYDSKRDDLYFHVALGEAGDQEALMSQVRLQLGQGIAGECALRRESINVRDAESDERVFRDADKLAAFQTRSLLAVPMVDQDELVGVVEVVNKVGGGGFSEVDRRLMEMFASLAASVLVNARLIEENLQSARLAAVGQTVAGLAHYTKNVLTGLMTSVDVIDAGLSQNNSSMLQSGWDVLKRSVDRISNVVGDMLSYSKAREPVYEVCDLQAIVDEAVETYGSLFERKGAGVVVELSDSLEIWADRDGLFRCMLNLIGNGVAAMPDSGGQMLITSRRNESGDVAIEVSDNGPGVPESLRDSIFDPFFSTKGSQGTGLGLAATEKIVHEHGGSIRVDDAPLGGARFVMTLPRPREHV